MPANATLEFASSVAGATATRPRPVAAVRLPCAAAGASRCEGSRVGVSVVGGGGDGHTRARPSAHCATRQRSWRAVDALRSAFFGREEECQPRRECVDARRGERALRDSADLLIDGTRPNPLWTSRRYPPDSNLKLETTSNLLSLRVEKQTGTKAAAHESPLLPRLRVLAAPNHSGWSSFQGESPHWSGEAWGRQPRYVRHPRRVFRLRTNRSLRPSRPIRQVSRRPSAHRRSSGR